MEAIIIPDPKAVSGEDILDKLHSQGWRVD